MGNSNSITPSEAKKLIKQNYFDVILDVRDKDEWNESHHPSATHIPLDRVKKKFYLKYPDRDINVLIYCRSGMRAGSAKEILETQGYSKISVLDGPYTNLL